MTTTDCSTLLHGGYVVDGSGCPPFRADVLISDCNIVAVGRLPHDMPSAHVIDCSGRYVMPGFVDAHVHGESTVFNKDVQLAMLAQGVTSIIVGQDGLSTAPAGPKSQEYVEQYFGAINGDLHLHSTAQVTVADVLESYDGMTPINVATLIPRGNVRLEVLGTDPSDPDTAALRAMQNLVNEGMEQGAVGLSTGLEYIPDTYGSAGEIAALASVSARYSGVYVTHMRGYEAESDIGVSEAQLIAHEADVPLHISHFHGPANMLQGLLRDCLGAGVDVTYDSYPYTKGATIVSMVGVPPELQKGGVSGTLKLLADPAVESLWRAWADRRANVFARIQLASIAAPEYAWAEGYRLTDAAREAGLDTVSFLRQMLLACELKAAAVFDQPRTNTLADVATHLKSPLHMAGSDSIYLGSAPHPRGWGTFARYLAEHTRKRRDYTWGEASQHLSGHAVRRFRLGRRGLIKEGHIADLVVLDPEQVRDTATYTDPRRPAAGIDRVFVNGVEVFSNGSLTGATPGVGIRRN